MGPYERCCSCKLGPRILYRLPEDIASDVLYYGGDGSELYFFDEGKKGWSFDPEFRRLFSDAQGIAVIGKNNYTQALCEMENLTPEDSLIKDRINNACNVLKENKLF